MLYELGSYHFQTLTLSLSDKKAASNYNSHCKAQVFGVMIPGSANGASFACQHPRVLVQQDMHREQLVTHVDRFFAIKLDSDPWLLNDIQVEARDGQGCVATGNKRPG